MMNTKWLLHWIKERHAVYMRRMDGQPKPWTKDDILRDNRFCNVYRELDTVTIWIADNWRTPHAKDPDLWFAMVVARLFNKPSTLQAIGYPVPWNPERVRGILHKLAADGETIFSGAYIVSTNGRAMNKVDYIIDYVLYDILSAEMRPQKGETLAGYHAKLVKLNGLGGFMAAQIIADIKYVEPLLSAPDWWSWAASGPGSRRGLNRVFGRQLNRAWPEAAWRNGLVELWIEISHVLEKWNYPQMHAQDLQNCLCEFDKYERVRLGEGRAKQRYDGRV